MASTSISELSNPDLVHPDEPSMAISRCTQIISGESSWSTTWIDSRRDLHTNERLGLLTVFLDTLGIPTTCFIPSRQPERARTQEQTRSETKDGRNVRSKRRRDAGPVSDGSRLVLVVADGKNGTSDRYEEDVHCDLELYKDAAVSVI